MPPAAQARPHIPQLFGSVFRSTSQPSAAPPLQLAKPELQLNPQVLPEHVRDAFDRAGHDTPQPPQLFTLELTVVSHPLTGIPSQLSKPMLQANPQSPTVHVALALNTDGQMLPHIPQLPTVVFKLVSQPLAAMPSQLPQPALHVNPQLLDEHVVLAFARAGHTVPQAPQWFTSDARVTHAPLHSTWPPVQPLTQAPPEHIGVPPEHTRPHTPQWLGLVRLCSQPLFGLPSQSPQPALHVKPQAPAVHVVVAFARAGHALPQAPQCVRLLLRSASHPSTVLPLQSPRPAIVHVYRHAPATHAAL